MTKQLKNIQRDILFEIPTLCAAMFAGATFYNSEIDTKVRKMLQTPALQLRHWKRMYRIGLVVAPIVIGGGAVAAMTAYYKTKQIFWIYGSAAFFAIIPWTFAFMMPINHYLEKVHEQEQKTHKAADDQKQKVLSSMDKWVNRHRVRGVLSLLAVGCFLIAKNFSKN